ncbi:hypothetical protein TNCT_685731 [Trichonephila clavata]|uniref:Uncharacterized protein n=1 Tax=Trichonephila clavata TaxID=2740835 RepID=A0A8X6GSZ0_TRICU|nr:hypothetical protein TNCT_685731 [Trichonephila clavata]
MLRLVAAGDEGGCPRPAGEIRPRLCGEKALNAIALLPGPLGTGPEYEATLHHLGLITTASICFYAKRWRTVRKKIRWSSPVWNFKEENYFVFFVFPLPSEFEGSLD